MDLLQLKEYFTDYSASTLIFALAISVIKQIISAKITSKIGKRILHFSPFVIGVLCEFVYECVLLKAVTFTEQTVLTGVMIGALSFAVTVIINRVKSGKKLPINKTQLTIEGLISEYVKAEALDAVVATIEEILCGADDQVPQTEQIKIELIAQSITANSNGTLTELDVTCLAQVIYTSAIEIEK